jgi:hypothetical protein
MQITIFILTHETIKRMKRMKRKVKHKKGFVKDTKRILSHFTRFSDSEHEFFKISSSFVGGCGNKDENKKI